MSIINGFVAKVLTCSVVVAGVVSVLPKYAFSPNPEGVWISHLLTVKEKAYKESLGPQLLLIAGSSGLLGFDSQLFTKLTGRHAVNFGLHAGLGIPYILSRAERLLKPGDTAILAFEYELYSSNRETTVKRFVSFYDREYIYTTNISDWSDFLLGYGLVEFTYAFFRRVAPMDMGSGYSFNLTHSGDFVDNTVETSSPEAVISSGVFSRAPLNTVTFNLLKQFAERCKERDITVLITYPPIHRRNEYVQRDDYQNYLHIMESALRSVGDGLIGSFENSELETLEMYDHRYHLTSDGRRRYTSQLATYFKEFQAKRVP